MRDLDDLEDSIVGSYDLCHVRASDVLDVIRELRIWRANANDAVARKGGAS